MYKRDSCIFCSPPAWGCFDCLRRSLSAWVGCISGGLIVSRPNPLMDTKVKARTPEFPT
jgi:hypothetical protein